MKYTSIKALTKKKIIPEGSAILEVGPRAIVTAAGIFWHRAPRMSSNPLAQLSQNSLAISLGQLHVVCWDPRTQYGMLSWLEATFPVREKTETRVTELDETVLLPSMAVFQSRYEPKCRLQVTSGWQLRPIRQPQAASICNTGSCTRLPQPINSAFPYLFHINGWPHPVSIIQLLRPKNIISCWSGYHPTILYLLE